MKRSIGLALMLVAVLAVPAMAGHKEAGHKDASHKDKEKSYEKCTEDTQTCLNHMAAKMKNSGWLGIEMDMDQGWSKVKITKVVPGSPAEAADFHAGDVLVSVNGVKFADNTDEKTATWEATRDKWLPGSRFTYVVSRSGRDVSLTPTLASLPPDVLAMKIGMHMMDHAQADIAVKK